MSSMEVASKDDTIRLNMEAFLPYICSCIQLTDLLTKIHYYTKEQRKELFNVYKQNNTESCKRALALLVNEFHEPGRFVAFKEAMATRGYPVIVKLLEGEYVPFNENCQKVIDLFTSTLVTNLNPEEILPYLESQGTLQSNDAQEVRAEAMNHGRQRACWLLLFHLPRRVTNWFRNFMEALIDARYNELAQRLEPDMYERIIIQKEECKVSEKGSMRLLVERISPYGSNKTRNNINCNENVDREGRTYGLPMTLNMKQTVSKLAGNEHVLQSKQYDTHDQGSVTQLKELTRMEQDEIYPKRHVGTTPRVEAKAIYTGQLIQYDRTFLLSLSDSPLSKTCTCLKAIEQFKDIVLPKTLPRKPGITIHKEERVVGENGSMRLLSAPVPESISPNGSNVTRNNIHCNENVDREGRTCDLSMTLNMKQTVSKLAGNKHVLQSMQYDIHGQGSVTQLKELTRMEQDETYPKRHVGTTPRVEANAIYTGKLIQYDRTFLLSLRDSPLSKTCTCWKAIEKFKDIVLPKAQPRKPGIIIQKEECVVGENGSMRLLAAPVPKSISSYGSNVTMNNIHCNENIDREGRTCDLSMTLNIRQTVSNLAGNKHVLQLKQYDIHGQGSVTQLKELTRMEQDETYPKRHVGTTPRVEAKAIYTGKLIQYDRTFLLSLRDSPLSKTCTCWKAIEKFKDIVLPKTLPRTPGITIQKEECVVGENGSMRLLAAPVPKSISSYGSNVTMNNIHCNENIDREGRTCDLSMTLNMKQTVSKLAENKHVLQSKQYDTHGQGSVTQLKELTRIKQDETYPKKHVGTTPRVEAKAIYTGKRIQYDRNFLLSLRDSPLSYTCTCCKAIEQFKDIVLTKTLPRTPEASAKQMSSLIGENNIETYVRSAETIPRRVFMSHIKKGNINSKIQPQIFENDLKSGHGGNGGKSNKKIMQTI